MAQRPTVMVVDDDESLRVAMQRLLDAAGFEPVTFRSAEEMLAAGVGEHVCVVVSDLSLPGASGYELIARLRQAGSQTAVILVTAHDEPGRCADALRRGASGYMAKPFRGTALLELVRTLSATRRD